MTVINVNFIYLLFFILPVAVDAQNVQQKSARVPSTVKVDGLLQEWGSLQANNSSNRIRYTISNDDDNLYLAIQSSGVWCNAKIAHGGITLIISQSVDKKIREKAATNVSITFPVIDKATASGINAKQYGYFDIADEKSNDSKKKMDSLYNAVNLLVNNSFKEIKIIGIKDIDTLVSVYNTYGIKAAAQFSKQMLYCYELAIPLKYLGLTIDNLVPFSYSIRLNGPTFGKRTSTRKIYNTEDPNDVPTTELSPNFDGSKAINPESFYKNYPSSLWAEYTLVKDNSNK
ncbi:hypothetical protein SAMN05216490_3471 [Mucilaginibacter mallensis]|uniref:Uncharacterized protein n=1 Tax=Mucilaginibacter mallensis TaxID=652787 RepID=A0A1H2ACR4_MUCMA|nr:hypothetical protein [Mucilaginibacter mallensis]SDT43552.1 hypothetical protein SAMN05216490_3471 [Mucilaginibacter mallensis]